ncbi:hypothetical protein SLA2020_400880 [Shorea laevis]
MSPTSILDGEPFTSLRNAFWSDSGTPRTPDQKPDTSSTSKGSALALSMLSGMMIPIPICQNPRPEWSCWGLSRESRFLPCLLLFFLRQVHPNPLRSSVSRQGFLEWVRSPPDYLLLR